ncbi:hypothetical protein OHAE_2562 [Ochrobactrum soli]|uniref:Uncharacterized protein n=1 Tax=Ochrobactrum soli TaxID=2448455 RepID=A0A2P9HRF9_9HYPH|nr:hypothetical protein OHAE_2562 [[Ochrobactrum] soli]
MKTNQKHSRQKCIAVLMFGNAKKQCVLAGVRVVRFLPVSAGSGWSLRP